ncbi:hypothetical protein BOX15_Mlig028915g2 [Macrostomum lignano]|uniref:Stabilizer of axonemal microtubules 2 n=2 Tax=Macrostomum lignano TaxID=282301 RepID=A0A1I8HXT3_9PLAT|nr:hypothetical protein BOX15_Mlig028915g2 [Macrostomum lignano]
MKSSRPEQCICEICNCGRHRCKVHPNRPVSDGPCTLSEYNNKYIQHPMQPVSSYKPAARPAAGDGPLSDQTTNRVDYVPHPLERPHFHQPDQYRQPEGSFEDTTMYKKDYTQKQGDRAQPIKREVKRGALGEFQGEPTYKHDYRQWELTKPDRGGPQNTWQPPRDPFGGIPTYQTDYVPYAVRPTASFKPNEAAKLSQAPLEDMTDYRQSYVPHPLERRQERERLGWSRPAVPFDGMSTFTRDYTAKGTAVRAPMKPDARPHASDAPFHDDTTHRVDYKPWELSRPFVHQSDTYVPPEGTIDDTTTYVKDYPAHPLVRQTYSKKPDRGLPSGPFDDATDYKDNYRQWQMGSRVRAGPNQQYQPNPAPFEGQSTTSSHYVPHPLDLRRSFKPTQGAARGEEPFDGTTLYRMEYVPKHTEPCPAAFLETNSSRFRYQGNDERGHQVYVPKDLSVGTTVTDLSNGRVVSVN